MTFKTKKRTGEVRLMQNKQQSDDILARHLRLTKSLKDAFNAGLIPASWVVEIAKIGGCHV